MQTYIEIYADSARGVYIPQYFAQSCKRDMVQGVSAEDWQTLESGPDTEFYWEAWESVLNNARITDSRGNWTLWQDGDLFLTHENYIEQDSDNWDCLVSAINEMVESYVDYEENHIDAGNNYSHMPAESWCSDKESRLIEQCKLHEIDLHGLDSDIVSDLALDLFHMESGHMFSNMESDYIVLDSYPIGETETQIEFESIDAGFDVKRAHIEQLGNATDCYIGSISVDSFLAYSTSDCVWFAVVKPSDMQEAIANHIAKQ